MKTTLPKSEHTRRQWKATVGYTRSAQKVKPSCEKECWWGEPTPKSRFRKSGRSLVCRRHPELGSSRTRSRRPAGPAPRGHPAACGSWVSLSTGSFLPPRRSWRAPPARMGLTEFMKKVGAASGLSSPDGMANRWRITHCGRLVLLTLPARSRLDGPSPHRLLGPSGGSTR